MSAAPRGRPKTGDPSCLKTLVQWWRSSRCTQWQLQGSQHQTRGAIKPLARHTFIVLLLLLPTDQIVLNLHSLFTLVLREEISICEKGRAIDPDKTPVPDGWRPSVPYKDERVWRGSRVAPYGANMMVILYREQDGVGNRSVSVNLTIAMWSFGELPALHPPSDLHSQTCCTLRPGWPSLKRYRLV